jgi:hypothetical protein
LYIGGYVNIAYREMGCEDLDEIQLGIDGIKGRVFVDIKVPLGFIEVERFLTR